MTDNVVAVVGRPNVGKSTFFNRLCGDKAAIVEDTPGVTRDRIFGDAEWLGYRFTLVDTGGIEPASGDAMLVKMRRQAELAIEAADVILFFVDVKDGLVASDYQVADILRQADKPVIVVANKADNIAEEQHIYEFYSLGIGDVFGISSSQGLGIGDLLDEVIKHLKPSAEEPEEENKPLSIALVGKPNVGKSSLSNLLTGEERSIVSETPGTTRDAIDSLIEYKGVRYIITDTAGMRKKARIEDSSVERYSVIRSLLAVRRSDVCVLLIDALSGVSEQDAKIAGYIHDEGKPVIIAVNKWDAVEKDSFTIEEHKKKIDEALSFMPYADKIFISAKTGLRVPKLFELINKAYENGSRRVSTGLLNDCLREAVTAVEPPSDKGRRLKVFYITQAAVLPPTFVLFVNEEQLMHFSYKRYIENYLRKTFDFEGTPIRLVIRSRGEGKGEL